MKITTNGTLLNPKKRKTQAPRAKMIPMQKSKTVSDRKVGAKTDICLDFSESLIEYYLDQISIYYGTGDIKI